MTEDFPLKKHVSPHGRTTAVTMMKDEAPFLLEWVAHHLALGFTDIVAYTNDCTDGTDTMLKRLETLGLVYHRENNIAEGKKPQPSALAYAQKEPIVQDSDWVVVFDADEFLVIKYGDGTVDDLITAAEARGANGIIITWRVYGSNDIVEWSRAPVSEQYTACAPANWFRGWGVKTLFKFDPEYWVLGIHRPKIKNKHIEGEFPDTIHWLNGSGNPMEDYFRFRGWRSIDRTVGYDWVQMNHYAVKSIDSYALRKFRGNVNNKKDKYNHEYWSLQDRNEVQDPCILRHATKRQKIYDILYSDPILKELHDKAIAAAEARLVEFKSTPEYAKFRDELIEASKVPIHQVVAKPPKPRDPEAIAAKMTKLEKLRNEQPVEVRRNPKARERFFSEPPAYVRGAKSDKLLADLECIESQGIQVPILTECFSIKGYEAAQAGKLERFHARTLPNNTSDVKSLLDFGGYIGFMAAKLAIHNADQKIYYSESDPLMRKIAPVLFEKNQVQERIETLTVDTDPLKGLIEALNASNPEALRVSFGELTAPDLLTTLKLADFYPSLIVLWSDALGLLGPEEDNARDEVMSEIGYQLDEKRSAAQAKYYVRQVV